MANEVRENLERCGELMETIQRLGPLLEQWGPFLADILECFQNMSPDNQEQVARILDKSAGSGDGEVASLVLRFAKGGK